MKNKRPFKWDKGGLYIALCCFALVVAAIGYVGRKKEAPIQKEPQKIASESINNTSNTNAPTVKKPQATVTVTESKAEPVNTPAPRKEAESVSAAKNVEVEDISITMPVDGNVICDFSGDNLVFNDVLDDWRTHNGIDISCDKDAAIYSAYDGVVSEITDGAMGRSVKIDHQNGYETVYSNLSDQIELMQGDTVKSGTLIGKVGASAVADFTLDPHLHFEVLLNGKYVNPIEFLPE